jgi:large subunit ribosomal protein L16
MSTFTPKKTKFKKQQRGKLTDKINKPILFDSMYGSDTLKLIAIESGQITPNQLLCCNQLLNKKLKKIGQSNLKIFPHTSITKKPLEIRMGKGKGAVNTYVFTLFTGMQLLEIKGNNINLIKKSLEQIKVKLPIKTKIIYAI